MFSPFGQSSHRHLVVETWSSPPPSCPRPASRRGVQPVPVFPGLWQQPLNCPPCLGLSPIIHPPHCSQNGFSRISILLPLLLLLYLTTYFQFLSLQDPLRAGCCPPLQPFPWSSILTLGAPCERELSPSHLLGHCRAHGFHMAVPFRCWHIQGLSPDAALAFLTRQD